MTRPTSRRAPDYILLSTQRVLEAVLPLFERSPGVVADPGLYAQYRRDVAALLADVRAAARSETLGYEIAGIARAYRQAAAEPRAVIAGLERVVIAARAVDPVAPTTGTRARQRDNEIALAMLLEGVALAEIAEAVAILTLRSHDEAQALRARIVRLIDVTVERAADFGVGELLAPLREAKAKLSRDLVERGRPLARIVGYSTAVPLPSVVLAHRFYQNAGREAELVAENATDHPSFMPMRGRAYSQ
jgi:prophage DNA circulation protein